MRAVVYNGPRDVSVSEVPDAKIEEPTDAVIRITATNICGSDLHMYEGRTDLEVGKVIGHENLGEVIEVGSGVVSVKVGDRVCLPFNIACGFCKNCQRGFTGFCLTVNPGSAGGAYGYADMGPYDGGQAELLRVPFADFNALQLPPDSIEKENDYVMLSDIFPTGWHGTRLAGMEPGDTVAVYGAGPVGTMAAYSAVIQGASQVFVVDHVPDRLALVAKFGATGIDANAGDPVEQIKEATGGEGVDRGVEAVGYQAHDAQGHEVPNMTMNALVDVVRATGSIGVVGVFVPEDPGAADELAKKGQMAFDFGKFFFKGQKIGTGQANVKAYNRQLRDLIHQEKAKPSLLVSHDLGLGDAPDAYRHFDAREDGWTKIVLHPERGLNMSDSTVTLADARRVIAAAEAKAVEIGQPQNIAVVDAGGNLVAHARMDNAWVGSIDIAQNKAWTARAFDTETKALAENSQSGGQFFGIHVSNGGRVMIFAGGIPLSRDGVIVGGIGVSGGDGDQDQTVAEAGAAAL